MEELINNLYSNSSAPVVSALILGLLTAISPCPMATNITAIGFIGKDIGNRNRVFYNGLVYTLGRTAAYFLLAFILYLGADQLKISGLQQDYRRFKDAKQVQLLGCVFAGGRLCPRILPL